MRYADKTKTTAKAWPEGEGNLVKGWALHFDDEDIEEEFVYDYDKPNQATMRKIWALGSAILLITWFMNDGFKRSGLAATDTESAWVMNMFWNLLLVQLLQLMDKWKAMRSLMHFDSMLVLYFFVQNICIFFHHQWRISVMVGGEGYELYPTCTRNDGRWGEGFDGNCGHICDSVYLLMIDFAVTAAHIFVNMRSSISWIIPTSATVFYALYTLVPWTFKEDDMFRLSPEGLSASIGSTILVAILGYASWSGRYLMECQHREQWLSNRNIRKDLELAGTLLRLSVDFCTLINYQTMEMKNTEEFEEIFGDRLMMRTLCWSDDEAFRGETFIEEVVKEEKAMNIDLNLTSREGHEMLECTVYGIPFRGDAMIGFKINGRKVFEKAEKNMENVTARITDKKKDEVEAETKLIDGWRMYFDNEDVEEEFLAEYDEPNKHIILKLWVFANLVTVGAWVANEGPQRLISSGSAEAFWTTGIILTIFNIQLIILLSRCPLMDYLRYDVLVCAGLIIQAFVTPFTSQWRASLASGGDGFDLYPECFRDDGFWGSSTRSCGNVCDSSLVLVMHMLVQLSHIFVNIRSSVSWVIPFAVTLSYLVWTVVPWGGISANGFMDSSIRYCPDGVGVGLFMAFLLGLLGGITWLGRWGMEADHREQWLSLRKMKTDIELAQTLLKLSVNFCNEMSYQTRKIKFSPEFRDMFGNRFRMATLCIHEDEAFRGETFCEQVLSTKSAMKIVLDTFSSDGKEIIRCNVYGIPFKGNCMLGFHVVSRVAWSEDAVQSCGQRGSVGNVGQRGSSLTNVGMRVVTRGSLTNTGKSGSITNVGRGRGSLTNTGSVPSKRNSLTGAGAISGQSHGWDAENIGMVANAGRREEVADGAIDTEVLDDCTDLSEFIH